MDASGPVNTNEYQQKCPKSTKEMSSRQMSQGNKIYSSNKNNLVLLENSCNAKMSSTTKNSVTIVPFAAKMKNSEKSMKIIPKITANNLPRNQRPKTETSTNFLNDDLGNILDIPIIFAKDGETINSIGKSPLLPPITIPNIPENPPPPRNPKVPTKVVLISNKQDKSQPPGKLINKQGFLRPNLTNQNLNLLLQPKNQNQVMKNRSSPPLQNSSRSHDSTVKYTKIILAKRNSLSSITHKDKGEPVILTKTNQKVSVPRIFNADKNEHRYSQVSAPKIINNFDDELLEIEEAIKPNIIERKMINSSEIESSQDKNFIQKERNIYHNSE